MGQGHWHRSHQRRSSRRCGTRKKRSDSPRDYPGLLAFDKRSLIDANSPAPPAYVGNPFTTAFKNKTEKKSETVDPGQGGVVGELAPGAPAQAGAAGGHQAAIVNPVHGQDRQPDGKGTGVAAGKLHKQLFHRQVVLEVVLGVGAPVIEVAGDQQGFVVGHMVFDPVHEDFQLLSAVGLPQPQVHTEGMQRGTETGQLHHAVENAAAGQVGAGDIDIFPELERVFTENGIAVVTGAVDGVFAIGIVGPEARTKWGISGTPRRLRL